MNEERAPFDAPKASPWGALLRVITEPAATFQSLGEKPPIAPGYVFAMVMTLITAAFTLPVMTRLAEQQMAGQAMPPGAETITRVIMIIGILFGSIVAPWLAGVVIALIALLFGQFQEGGAKSFGAYFGMVGYARVPLALMGLVQGLMTMRVTSMEQAQKVTLSLGALLPADASPILRGILSVLNPFGLWYYALLAIGFATLHRTKATNARAMIITMLAAALVMSLVGGAVGNFFANMQPRM